MMGKLDNFGLSCLLGLPPLKIKTFTDACPGCGCAVRVDPMFRLVPKSGHGPSFATHLCPACGTRWMNEEHLTEAEIRRLLGLKPSLPKPGPDPKHPERQTGRTTDMIVKGLARLAADDKPVLFVSHNQMETERVVRIAREYAAKLGLPTHKIHAVVNQGRIIELILLGTSVVLWDPDIEPPQDPRPS